MRRNANEPVGRFMQDVATAHDLDLQAAGVLHEGNHTFGNLEKIGDDLEFEAARAPEYQVSLDANKRRAQGDGAFVALALDTGELVFYL